MQLAGEKPMPALIDGEKNRYFAIEDRMFPST